MERLKQALEPAIDIDESKGIVRVYINKFNVVDAAGDVSLPGSFSKTFNERLKKMWWLLNHDWEKSLGLTLSLEEDGIGSIATGQFNLKKEIARDTFSDYLLFAENGRSLQHSVRVEPIKYLIEKDAKGRDIMKVSEWKMREWSTLTQPAAIEDTPLISIKAEKELFEQALKMSTYTDERLKYFEDKIKEMEALLKGADPITLLKQPNPSIENLVNHINNLTF
jgi:HK97 family phage prohead protease